MKNLIYSRVHATCFTLCSTCMFKIETIAIFYFTRDVLTFLFVIFSCKCLMVVHLNFHNVYMPGFLKTGLAKIRTHSTTWQLKTIKFVQRSIKSLFQTQGIKYMLPRSIPMSRSLK